MALFLIMFRNKNIVLNVICFFPADQLRHWLLLSSRLLWLGLFSRKLSALLILNRICINTSHSKPSLLWHKRPCEGALHKWLTNNTIKKRSTPCCNHSKIRPRLKIEKSCWVNLHLNSSLEKMFAHRRAGQHMAC